MTLVFARISLKTTAEGGRQTPITSQAGRNYGCPAFFTNVPQLSAHGYDCRIFFENGKSLAPGETLDRVPLAFLYEDDVLPWLFVGAVFNMWEGKAVGTAEIIEIGSASN